ncbi:MAG: hypothetical protein KBB64_09020 [Bacteroidia bacterium]|nr:hypothetical protein [Bacteroidia bacterium]
MNNRSTPIILLLAVTILSLIFHLLIIIGVIPYELTWGGKLESTKEMLVFETISIVINLFFLHTLLQKGSYIRSTYSKKFIRIILWVFFILFILNTAGNIQAVTTFEKCLTVVTGLNAVLLLMILLRDKESVR